LQEGKGTWLCYFPKSTLSCCCWHAIAGEPIKVLLGPPLLLLLLLLLLL
jgi:hypothetical protein